jgi:hypothetical protein
MQPHYGAGRHESGEYKSSWLFVSRLPTRHIFRAIGVNENGIKQVCS